MLFATYQGSREQLESNVRFLDSRCLRQAGKVLLDVCVCVVKLAQDISGCFSIICNELHLASSVQPSPSPLQSFHYLFTLNSVGK